MQNPNNPQLIYEDDSLYVLNKPSGWIVNAAETTKDQPVVQKWLDKNFDYPLVSSREFRSGVVHRLDKETSGILLIAKTKEAFEYLQDQFKNREVEKTYIALVHGRVEPERGEIKATVGRLPWRRDRFGVLSGGRESETRYSVIRYYEKENEKYSLLELKPKTGRTHQIRIHLKHLGHPIVADTFYAGRKTSRADRKWCPRLFLHAAKISFRHQQTGKVVKYEAKLASDLKSVLNTLQN